jgi:enoyl-[acyl-carrier protein] reductase II
MDLMPISDARADDEAQRRLDELWRRGRAFLGTRYAILGGAMSWVSESGLVSAISNAGGFGVVACGSLSPDALGAEIAATSEKTDRPFGVNLITIHPELTELIDTCIGLGVGHVILAGGLPPKTAITRIKDSGAKVVCFAPTLLVGRKLVRQGVDALIIEGMEAGGHTGPVSASVLAQEILPHLRDVPVFVGGGIGRGESIASYLEMGASGVQLGTRFVCARESIAHPKFKQVCIRANARDAQLSVQLDPMFPVIPVRALPNKATERFIEVQRETIERFREGKIGQKDAQLEIERFWAGALRRAVIEGDVENGSLMAGQSVGMVDSEQPMTEIFDQLIGQILATLAQHNRHGP